MKTLIRNEGQLMHLPLYKAIESFSQEKPLRLHMPGHKGKAEVFPPLAQLLSLDVTELPPTGNLYSGGAPFDAAHALFAQGAGFDACQFLTGGATQGLFTALSLFTTAGDAILLDRNCHRSVANAMALLDLHPIYLAPRWMAQENMVGQVSPRDVRMMLENHPEIKTVCITSPNYYGIISDVAQISSICHQYGARLLVDGAHGAHLPFLGVDAFAGADMVVCSTHKTMPALGQSAVLLWRNTCAVTAAQVREKAAVFGTSSPSYPILASIDFARAYMQDAGRESYARAADFADTLRAQFPSLSPETPFDRTRLVLMAKDGMAAQQALFSMGIYPEMADSRHLVFILTGADDAPDMSRLSAALSGLSNLLGRGDPLLPPPMAPRAVSPRTAFFGARETLPLSQCLGRVAACHLAPYPPGVPVVSMGERLTKKELSYFEQIRYNNDEVLVLKETE